jgi:SAM-dependent methyltransferase
MVASPYTMNILEKLLPHLFTRSIPEINPTVADKRKTARIPLKAVAFGDLKRLSPIGKELGGERGIPIDRYYIRKFLQTYTSDIRGQVLEFEDNYYTQEFGGKRVVKSDIMNLEAKMGATVVGDITKAEFIPANTYDCVICTQTLFIIYDMRSALRHLHRILKPGGVLLVTFPGISPRVDTEKSQGWHDCWRLTNPCARRLFSEFFPENQVNAISYGNVYVATCFLYGLALDELTQDELDYHDPHYEVTVGVRAVKK